MNFIVIYWNEIGVVLERSVCMGFYMEVANQTYVGDSGLKRHEHQGWYERSKFIGMQPRTINAWASKKPRPSLSKQKEKNK